MKPIVITVSDKLSKEDIEKIIEEAYNAGYSDGYEARGFQLTLNPPYNYPNTTPTPYWDINVTCESNPMSIADAVKYLACS